MFCDRRPLEPLVFPVISVAVHPLVHMIPGFINIMFSPLGACYKVDNIGHLTTSVAPKLDCCPRRFRNLCGGIILQVLHLALPHGRVSPSGSSSRMSGLSLARTRRSRRLLELLLAMVGLSVKISLKVLGDSMMGQCLLTISTLLASLGDTPTRRGERSTRI